MITILGYVGFLSAFLGTTIAIYVSLVKIKLI